jgi:hypothetical protein
MFDGYQSVNNPKGVIRFLSQSQDECYDEYWKKWNDAWMVSTIATSILNGAAPYKAQIDRKSKKNKQWTKNNVFCSFCELLSIFLNHFRSACASERCFIHNCEVMKIKGSRYNHQNDRHNESNYSRSTTPVCRCCHQITLLRRNNHKTTFSTVKTIIACHHLLYSSL